AATTTAMLAVTATLTITSTDASTSTVIRVTRLAGTIGLGSWSGSGFIETSKCRNRSKLGRRLRLRLEENYIYIHDGTYDHVSDRAHGQVVSRVRGGVHDRAHSGV